MLIRQIYGHFTAKTPTHNVTKNCGCIACLSWIVLFFSCVCVRKCFHIANRWLWDAMLKEYGPTCHVNSSTLTKWSKRYLCLVTVLNAVTPNHVWHITSHWACPLFNVKDFIKHMNKITAYFPLHWQESKVGKKKKSRKAIVYCDLTNTWNLGSMLILWQAQMWCVNILFNGYVIYLMMKIIDFCGQIVSVRRRRTADETGGKCTLRSNLQNRLASFQSDSEILCQKKKKSELLISLRFRRNISVWV